MKEEDILRLRQTPPAGESGLQEVSHRASLPPAPVHNPLEENIRIVRQEQEKIEARVAAPLRKTRSRKMRDTRGVEIPIPTKTSEAPIPAHLAIPSFTGTTITEAMRYERPLHVRVLRSFRRNNVVLMACGVAYTTLLSIIPLFALIFVVLSQFFDKELLLRTLTHNLRILIPGDPKLFATQLNYFLGHRELFGGINLIILLFFSSMAFSMLENAMSVIYAYDKTRAKRRFWVSATIPYIYIILIFCGILFLTVVATMLQAASGKSVEFLGLVWSLEGRGGAFLYFLGFVGLSFLLTSLYIIMPKCKIAFHRALIGGFVAACLWEVTRRVLVWYFYNISPVNAIYGPIATIIVMLLSLEIASVILLFGAQVIAELERFQSFQELAALHKRNVKTQTSTAHIQISS